MNIEIKEGVIYGNGKVVGVFIADKIARANGFVFFEQFVKKYAGKSLSLDDNFKITHPTEKERKIYEWAVSDEHGWRSIELWEIGEGEETRLELFAFDKDGGEVEPRV